jgi:uncharacterized lipoprotein YmbA
MRPVRALAAALAGGVLTSACGASPESTFYALGPVDVAPGAPKQIGPRAVRVRRPGIAGYLDRPEIVRRVADHRLGLTADERWGEPFDAMVGRVLAQDLQARIPGASVFTDDGAISAHPDAIVEVDVQRFDAGEDGTLTLFAEVAIETNPGHKTSTTRSVRLTAPPPGPKTAALVAAMSTLLARLADQVAAFLREPASSEVAGP